MDLESVIQGEVSQKEKNKYHILRYICRIQKNDKDELICRAGTEVSCRGWTCEHGGLGEGECEMNWEIRIDIYTLQCVK